MNALNLNISLAWERVKKDLQKRNFVNATIFHEIVEFHIEEWLQSLKMKFESGDYYPKSMEVIEIPKGKGLIRPGSLLTLEDNIFYSALVQECYLQILKRISWAQGNVDFSYILTTDNANSSNWFKDRLEGWKRFGDKSLEVISSGYKFVIVTDITGFYENIDIQTLISDLKSCNISSSIVDNISTCLNRWSQVNGKGIPQGHSASDLLAKLYLNTVDQGMRNANFCHLRYVDDIRIFCKTEAEANKALMELSRLLRKRGLNLQSAKTKILSAEKATQLISGARPTINKIKEEFKKEVLDFVNVGIFYGSIDEIFESDDESDAPIEVIRKAMSLYFIDDTGENFDKTLFHFLINKMIKYKEPFALDYCLSLLKTHPEETEHILSYMQSLDAESPNYEFEILWVINKLFKFLASEDAVYDYQNFSILNWLGKYSVFCLDQLLPMCRQVAFDNNKPYYYRFVARDILGKVGNSADLEKLEDHVSKVTSEIEKAELLCCLTRIEKSKRNSLFSRISNDGPVLKMAVDFIKMSAQ